MEHTNFLNLKEDTKHGDFILPFSLYKGTLDKSYPNISLHWHEELEIIYILDGHCQFKVDLESFLVNKGDILIVGPQKLHSLTASENSYMTWVSFVFNINMLTSSNTDGALIKYFSPILNNTHELPFLIKSNNLIYDKLLCCIENIMYSYYENEIAYELEIKSNLLHFFALMYKADLILRNDKSISLNTTDKIKLVLNYIHNNYTKDISVESLARICDFSEYHFMRFFKKHIGLTCIQYINNFRLEKASHMLIFTKNTIMDISLEVGFDNLSYFNKLFKRKYNLTPKEFRAINNKL